MRSPAPVCRLKADPDSGATGSSTTPSDPTRTCPGTGRSRSTSATPTRRPPTSPSPKTCHLLDGTLGGGVQGGELRVVGLPAGLGEHLQGGGRAGALVAILCHSTQTRSSDREAYSPVRVRHSSTVSGSMVKPNRAANWAPRSTRNGSSANASVVWRRTPRSRSPRPPQQSMTSPVFGPHMRALMVESRRPDASAMVASGSAMTSKPVWPTPVLESRRGRDTSKSSPPVLIFRTENARPTSSTYPTVASPSRSVSMSRPKTSMSTSFGRPPGDRRASRTEPPTSYGWPPAPVIASRTLRVAGVRTIRSGMGCTC